MSKSWTLTRNCGIICYVHIHNSTSQNFKKADINAYIFSASVCDHYRFQEVFGAVRIW